MLYVEGQMVGFVCSVKGPHYVAQANMELAM